MTPATARVQQALPAPPEVAYDAWLRAESLAGFICPAPGRAEVTIDPRLGGRIAITMIFPDRHTEIEGEYLELERPHRLSFSWRPLARDWESVVTVSFERHGADETLMTIVHSLLPAEWRDSYLRGWGSICETLEQALRGRASA